MNSRERMLAALRGQQADRVPIDLFGSTGCSPRMEGHGANSGRLLAYGRH